MPSDTNVMSGPGPVLMLVVRMPLRGVSLQETMAVCSTSAMCIIGVAVSSETFLQDPVQFGEILSMYVPLLPSADLVCGSLFTDEQQNKGPQKPGRRLNDGTDVRSSPFPELSLLSHSIVRRN